MVCSDCCQFVLAVHIVVMYVCVQTGVTSHIDDEYQMAGVDDPRILITTSRSPSARLKQFAKVWLYVFLSYFTTLCFFSTHC